MKIILPISKREKDFLLSKGLKFHKDIFKTYSGNGKYYCREEKWIIRMINEYRESLKTK